MILFNSMVVLWLLTTTAVHAGRDHSYNDERIKKTIQSSDGDIIDCFDIFKQPGLDHPLLKNHTIKMKPDRTAEELFRPKSKPVGLIQTWQLSGTCPEGTVPIRRSTSDTNTTFHFPDFSLPVLSSSPGKAASPRLEWAADFSHTLGLHIYHGVSADITIWDIHVDPDEFSYNYIAVFGSEDDTGSSFRSQISGGWMVDRAYFGDSFSRLLIFYTSDSGHNVRCRNTECGGFVQTNPSIALGTTFAKRSQLDGEHMALAVNIHRDQADYKWWMSLNHTEVGYYPGVPRSGRIANYLAIDGTGTLVRDDPTGTLVSHPGCYNISEMGYGTLENGPGYYTLYGGPGGPGCDIK